MSRNERASFFATIEELPSMLLWVRSHLIDANMDPSAMQKMEIATEEAIVNIIHHAYQQAGGVVEVAWKQSARQVELTILDYGAPFNPLEEAPNPDLSAPLAKRREGGLGIFLMRKCVDLLHYKRESGANVLTLIKHFSQKR